MSLYSSNSDKDAKHTKTRIRCTISEVTNYRRGAKHKNIDSSPMLSDLDLNCRLTKRKKKREEQCTCGCQSPVAIGCSALPTGGRRISPTTAALPVSLLPLEDFSAVVYAMRAHGLL